MSAVDCSAYNLCIYQSYAPPSLVGGGWGILGGGGHGTLFHFLKSDNLIVNNKMVLS